MSLGPVWSVEACHAVTGSRGFSTRARTWDRERNPVVHDSFAPVRQRGRQASSPSFGLHIWRCTSETASRSFAGSASSHERHAAPCGQSSEVAPGGGSTPSIAWLKKAMRLPTTPVVMSDTSPAPSRA